MQKENRKHQIISHYQIVVDQFHNVTLIGYDNLKDEYDVAILQYSKTEDQAIKPLKQLTRKRGPFKQFSQVKQTTSKYSKIINAKALLGTIKFLQGYYLIYVQQISHVGAVNNKPVYTIDKISIIPLFNKFNDSTQADQQKHLQLLSTYEFQDLFFSYSYDLSCTLIQNMNRQTSEEFVWNHYFKEQLSQIVGSHWVPNIIHGFFCHSKSSTTKLNNIKLKFDLTIISRRNINQDGVRYLKRGINQHGYVANHVQTQQIVALPEGVSSFLMVRGSVPVYWKQQPSIVNFQPKIEVMEHNSEYRPAQKHFYELIKRYGANIHCINLLREEQSKPRQQLLTDQFQKLVDQISNTQKGIYYYEYDVKKQLKNFQQFQKQVMQLSYYLLLQTGCNIIYKNNNIVFQNGVARINCVDCLDRTNLFMSILGQVALVFQLKSITRLAINYSDTSIKQEFCQIYSNIHQHLGNAVSLQYGGSQAQKHKSNVNKSQLLISLKRHITNNTSDYLKQQQIDICHGNYSRIKPYIWESFLQRTQRTESMNNLQNIREWISQAQTQYIAKTIKKCMKKTSLSLLKSLREDFMDTMIYKTHLSLKNVSIKWGDCYDYQMNTETNSPNKVLKQDNTNYEIQSPTKSTTSREARLTPSFLK